MKACAELGAQGVMSQRIDYAIMILFIQITILDPTRSKGHMSQSMPIEVKTF